MGTNQKHSARKHSDFSASASKRWMTCPGSVALSKKAPPQPDNAYAVEGTKAHECTEFVVRRFSNLEKARIEALKKWPVEMVDHAIDAAETIYKLKPSKTAKLLIETRVTLTSIGKEFFGTLDYAWIDLWGELVVIDYKYGAGVPVLPIDDETKEPNPQLMYYALGIALKYNFEFERVKLAIIQPRVWKEDEDPLTEGVVKISQLRDFEKQIKKAVIEAKKPNAPLVPSEDACRWCNAASFCPAISKMQMKEAGIVFDVETGIEDEKLPEVEALNERTFPKVLKACDLLETWIDQVRAKAFLHAAQGNKIPGWKLVQKRSTRKWLPEAERLAKKKFGDKAFASYFLTPAQLEKIIGPKGKDFANKFSSNESSGVTLVPESDKRPEVKESFVFDLDVEE